MAQSHCVIVSLCESSICAYADRGMTLMVTTTAIYAGILAIISIVLAHGAGMTRARLGIPLGDGGNGDLISAIRRHANFVEFVPLIVVMMAMIEINGAKTWWIHGFGIAIVIARIIHPIGISHSQMSSP